MVSSSVLASAISKTLVLVLAGGKGSRLGKLTQNRAKPAVEFGGQHRIIDFTLSNCVNSGFTQIAVITQYKSQCLISHLMQHWGHINTMSNGRLDILPAYSKDEQEGYTGTADACFKNLDYIRSVSPDFILILSGDQVYQMDYRQLLVAHLETKSDMTLSCLKVPVDDAARQLGVVSVNHNNEIQHFAEKPDMPTQLPDSPGQCLTSMGLYLFNTKVCCDALKKDALTTSSSHDFGKDLIPALIGQRRVFAHLFRGLNGSSTPYWRDVGTLDSYWQCHMDLLLSPDRLRMDNPDWPLRGAEETIGISSIRSSGTSACELNEVQLANGCHLEGSRLSRSILFARCHIAANSTISHAVLLPDVSVGSHVRLSHVIVDNGCKIPDNTTITDPDWARHHGFTVTKNGIILITQHDLSMITRITRDASSATQRHYCSADRASLPFNTESHYDIDASAIPVSGNENLERRKIE